MTQTDSMVARSTQKFQYNFPACNRFKTMQDQLKYAAGEIVEASAETNMAERAVEIMDAIHALETALRNTGLGSVELDMCRAAVITKNAKRDYYSKEVTQ